MKKFNLGEIIDEIIPYGCIMAGNSKYKFNKYVYIGDFCVNNDKIIFEAVK